jgi:hypothetical protein
MLRNTTREFHARMAMVGVNPLSRHQKIGDRRLVMLNVPIGGDLDLVEARVRRLARSAVDTSDHLKLRQLWCLLRNAERSEPAGGDARGRLNRMRKAVAEELAKLE